jgi:hypothetical protein
MTFIVLVFLAAFALESMGTWVSIIGLSSLFAGSPLVIALAVCLDFAKVVGVSFLYKYWGKVNWLMKSYMTVASLVLMLITSAGAFGFLSSEFQKAISNTNQQEVVLAALTEEQGRLQARKEEIDSQIAKLPDNSVRGRTNLMKQFAPEVKHINERLIKIDEELPKLKIEAIKKGVEVGPIIYIAQAFNTTPEHAVKWIILIIIFVFDPLAIALLLAGNYLTEIRPKKKSRDFQELPEPELFPPMPAIQLPKSKEPVIIEQSLSDLEKESQHFQELPEPERYPEMPVIQPHKEQKAEEPIVVATEEPQKNIPHPEEDQPEETIEQVDALIDEPLPEEPAREVITIKQITKPPPVKSSLESVDGARGDIQMGSADPRSMRQLAAKYADFPPTVFGSGPKDKF